jgi:hypothetical protein
MDVIYVNSSFQIIVIILSALLMIFLGLGIAVMVKVYQVAKLIKSIVEKAEDVAENIETASEMVKNTANPSVIGRLAYNGLNDLLKHVIKSKKRK